MTTTKTYKPTREQQRQFIKQYFPKVLPSEAAAKLLAKNNPNFTEAGLFRFLAAEGLDREFAIYCWLKHCKNKYDRLRSEIPQPDRFESPEPSSFAPQTTSLNNWLNATIAQDLLDLDRASSDPRRWDIRRWLTIVFAIELLVCGSLWMREPATPSANSQQISQR